MATERRLDQTEPQHWVRQRAKNRMDAGASLSPDWHEQFTEQGLLPLVSTIVDPETGKISRIADAMASQITDKQLALADELGLDPELATKTLVGIKMKVFEDAQKARKLETPDQGLGL